MVQTPAQTIAELKGTAGLNAKIAILRDNGSNDLKNVLKYTLDPFIVFGVKKVEFAEPNKIELDNGYSAIFDLCQKLSTRYFSGDAARTAIKNVSATLSEDQQSVLKTILAKDLKAGVAEKSINKVFPDLIPSFDVQLAEPHEESRIKYPCLCQPKYDGVRTLAFVFAEEGTVHYYSRNGKLFLNFDKFSDDLIKMSMKQDTVFDGEVVGPPGDEFRGIMQQVRRKYDAEPKGLSFRVFDKISVKEFRNQACALNQKERQSYLEELSLMHERKEVKIVKGQICNTYSECLKYYEDCVAKGYEGIIIKNLNSYYEYKRSYNWQKIKPTASEDLQIIEVKEGREGTKLVGKLGAFVVERNGVKINVGSGLDKSDQCSIEEAQKFIGKTIEVCFDSITPDGSFRFPRFVRFRDDK